MLGNRDWLRDTLIIVFIAYLFNIIYTSIVKLQERQIGSTEVTKDASTLLMPSITFCPAAMRDYSDKNATNITEEYANLPTPLDWLTSGLDQNVLINNRSQPVILSLSNYKDFFQISIGPTEQNDGIKACLTYNPPGPYWPGFQRDFGLLISVQRNFSKGNEWIILIHDQGSMMHNSPGNFGSAFSYTDTSTSNFTTTTIHEIKKRAVSYLNDDRTPCQSMPRKTEMNTCIQQSIEKEIGCQLPWNNVSSSVFAKCTESSKYKKFLTTYDEISKLSERSIAERTGCLPSCKRNEFTVNILNRIENPSDPIGYYKGYFYYVSGRYVEKSYYYVYDLFDLLADVGGYMGLLVGYSLLTVYDSIKYFCKKALLRICLTK